MICRTCKEDKPGIDFCRTENRCKLCCNERMRAYRKKNKDKTLSYGRRYYAEHRAERLSQKRKSDVKYRDKLRSKSKAWRDADPARLRKSQRATREKYRFRIALRRALLQAKRHGHMPCIEMEGEIAGCFTGFCAICGMRENGRKLHMDHDHVTGKFRGWLCHACNVGLGQFRDSRELLTKASEYLQNE